MIGKSIIDFLEKVIKNNGDVVFKTNINKKKLSIYDKYKLLQGIFKYSYGSALSHATPVITYRETKSVSKDKKIYIENVLKNINYETNCITISVYDIFYIPEEERSIDKLENILNFYKLIKKYTYEYKCFGLSILYETNPMRIDISAMYENDDDNRLELKEISTLFINTIKNNQYLNYLFNTIITENLKTSGSSFNYISGEYTLNIKEHEEVYNIFHDNDLF